MSDPNKPDVATLIAEAAEYLCNRSDGSRRCWERGFTDTREWCMPCVVFALAAALKEATERAVPVEVRDAAREAVRVETTVDGINELMGAVHLAGPLPPWPGAHVGQRPTAQGEER